MVKAVLWETVLNKLLSPNWFAFLHQTAFSDFLMGSSKDLAKHIKVVVSVMYSTVYG